MMMGCIKPLMPNCVGVQVIEHVYEKVMNGGSEAGSGSGTPTGERHGDTKQDRETESSSMAEERVELLCNDTNLDANMDLRTVKYFIWKSGSDLVLHYRLVEIIYLFH